MIFNDLKNKQAFTNTIQMILNFEKFWFVLLIFVFFNYYLYVFHFSRLFELSDAYYYLSLADSWLSNHLILDITVSPPDPIVTSQNGIVIFNVILKLLKYSNIEILYIMSVINLICFILFLSILNKILVKLNIEKIYRSMILLSLVLPYSNYRYILQPLNDTLYMLMTGLIIYYIILYSREKCNRKLIILIVLSVIVCNFRMQGFIPFISASIVFLLKRKYMDALIFLILCMISIFSVEAIMILLKVDKSGIYLLQNEVIQKFSFSYFIKGIYDIYVNALSTLIFLNRGIIPGILLFIFMSLHFINIFQKNYIAIFDILFLTFFVILYILFFMLFYVHTPRYFVMLSPFLLLMILFLFNNKELRLYIFIFYLIVLVHSNLGFIMKDSNVSSVKQSFEIISQDLPDEFNLISDDSRITFFYLNKPSICFEDIKGPNVVVVGSKEFSIQLINQIKELHKVTKVRRLKKDFRIFRKRKFVYILSIKSG